MSKVFVEAALFDAAGLPDDCALDWDGGHSLRLARRLLVLAWLYAGGVSGDPGELPCARSVAFWAARRAELGSWRPATLATVLLQLEALGAVEGIDLADGGFHAQLREG